MWEFLMGLLLGDAVGKSPLGRFVRPFLKLVLLGLVLVGFIYACAVFRAVNERSGSPHVHAHSPR